MCRRIVISIILVCVFGCGNEHLEEKISDLEAEKKSVHLQLEEQRISQNSTSEVINAITSLVKNIQETELKIDDKKQTLRVESVEGTLDSEVEILNDIQNLYDELKLHRLRAEELQKKLDSFVNQPAQPVETEESVASLKMVIEEKTLEIDSLEKEIDSLKSQVAQLENSQGELTNQVNSYVALEKEKNSEISTLKEILKAKDLVISNEELKTKRLQERINTVNYMVGVRDDLINRGIVAKRGIPVVRKLNPFSHSYCIGPNCTSSKFTQEKRSKTIYRMDGKIVTLLPFRDKKYYDVYYEDGVSVINIKDSNNFWYVKYLVVVTH
ncbi:MAG: hypothetical protein GY941_21400 [Planctomycetes bacterium]|nr:hypothetical protein [Planctomycetota bacterium]